MLKNLTNGRTSIALDENGAIVRVVDTKTKHAYFDACESDRQLFDIVAPSSTWLSRSVTVQEGSKPAITERKDEYILRYENLELSGEKTGISTEVSFKMPAGTDEILLSLKLSNHGKETITCVLFPWINGWKSPGDPSIDKIRPGPNAIVDPASFPRSKSPAEKIDEWAKGTFDQEITTIYPVHVMVPWIDFSGEKGGVSCINYQQKPRMCFAGIKNMAGLDPGSRMGILWGFYAYVSTGNDWESPAIGISVHDGDWHLTADRYRQRSKTWITPAPAKPEFRERIGSLHVFFKFWDGTIFRSHEEIPDIAASARKYGVKELGVWDKLSLGLNASYNLPSDDTMKYSSEDRQVLSKAIHKAVEEGTDVSALVGLRLINTMLDVYKNENFKAETQTTLDGSTKAWGCKPSLIPCQFIAWFVGTTNEVFSPFSKKYQKRVLDIMQAYLDLGYTSLFHDEPFELFPDYSRKDKGCIPEMTYVATLELIGAVRKKLREKNPDAVIMGEQCDVFGSEVIDQWMAWEWSDRNLEAAIRVHYAIPQTVINCAIGGDNPGLASHAFAAGLHLLIMVKGGRGTLADVPEFAGHVKKLADLRKRCAERTVHARFNHTLGISGRTDDGVVAYSYDSADGPAVIIAAPVREGNIKINLDRASFSHPGTPDKGQVFHLDGRVVQVVGDTQKFSLEKYEVIVWTA